MPKIAELDMGYSIGLEHHLYFRFTNEYPNVKSALNVAKELRNAGHHDIFIWDGTKLPVDANDQRTQQILNCRDCVEDITIQNQPSL